jgi:hypothetical protein
MEVLGNLLFVEEAVIATAHKSSFDLENKTGGTIKGLPETPSTSYHSASAVFDYKGLAYSIVS